MKCSLLIAAIVAAFSAPPLAAQSLEPKPATVTLVGEFDSYITTTKLEVLLVHIITLESTGAVVAVVCEENDQTGCDLFHAGDDVLVQGTFEETSTCDDGEYITYFNRILPLRAWRCNGGACVDLAP